MVRGPTLKADLAWQQLRLLQQHLAGHCQEAATFHPEAAELASWNLHGSRAPQQAT